MRFAIVIAVAMPLSACTSTTTRDDPTDDSTDDSMDLGGTYQVDAYDSETCDIEPTPTAATGSLTFTATTGGFAVSACLSTCLNYVPPLTEWLGDHWRGTQALATIEGQAGRQFCHWQYTVVLATRVDARVTFDKIWYSEGGVYGDLANCTTTEAARRGETLRCGSHERFEATRL